MVRKVEMGGDVRGRPDFVEESDRRGDQGLRLQKRVEVVRLSRHGPRSAARPSPDSLNAARKRAEDAVQE